MFAQNTVVEIPGVGPEFFFNWARLDQSGPRSRCHCLPVSQHCLPGSRVTRMISHILISHFYGLFKYLWIFWGLDQSGSRPRCQCLPVPGPDFIFYHCLCLLCPKAGGMICFVWLALNAFHLFFFSCVSEFPSLGQEWSQVQLSVSSSQPTTASSIQCRPRCHVCILELFIQLPCLNILDIGAKHDTRKVS